MSAADVYTLKVGDESRTFTALQIVSATLAMNVGANDVLEINQKVDALPDGISSFLPDRAYVRLFENGQQIFCGRVKPRLRATQGALRQPYQIVGGWSELACRYYAQPWAAGEGVGINYGRVALGWNSQTSEFVSTGDQILAAVQWSILRGAPLAVGAISHGIEIVPEYLENQTCAQIISRCLEFTPHHVPFFDYSAATPKFYCAAASNPLEEGLSGMVGIVTNSSNPFAFGNLATVTIDKGMFVGNFEVRRSFEGDIAGVVMAVKKQVIEDPEDVPEGVEPKYLTSWIEVKRPTIAQLGDEGVVPFSFDSEDFPEMTDAEIIEVLENQAETFLLGASHYQWSGTGTVKGQLAPRVPGVGYRINISGGDESWGTMNAIVTSSRRDLIKGTNTITWGPPASRSLAEMMKLALGRRHRNAFIASLREEQATGKAEQQNGSWNASMGKKKSTSEDTGEGSGGGPHGTKVITVLDGGGLVDVTVWTEPAA